MNPPLAGGFFVTSMQKQWKRQNVDQAAADRLAAALGLLPATARILVSRGLTEPELVREFLAPSLSGMLDPLLLSGMSAAVQRLVTARAANESVCIYGDYDVDGISATALLVSGLAALGLQTGYHIPNRMDDGYGLNSEALQQIRQRGYRLAVSVDCGVTALEEARFCRQIGLDLIITDHHQPLSELPAAVAVINPHQPGCNYPFKGLAGVGVAFNLLVALRSRLREQGLLADGGPDLRQWLDLVALGTVADLVPLIGQNRLLVAAGLQRLGNGCRTGMAALKQVAGITGTISSGQVGFQLAPRLNAVGRLESAVPGVELLLSTDPQQAAALAGELDGANQERRQVERRMFAEAVQQLEQMGWSEACRSIVLWSTDWHQGVVGIVASRLVERYHRPVMLIALQEDGSAKGSGRSISGFHLLEALHGCSDLLLRYGGHRAAAGITLAAVNLPAFRDAFEAASRQQLADSMPRPELLLDAELQPAELTLQLARELQQLGPFGMANPTPLLLVPGMQVVSSRRFGDGNLNLQLAANGLQISAVGWGMAERTIPGRIDLVCTLRIDSWSNRDQLKLELKDFRAAA